MLLRVESEREYLSLKIWMQVEATNLLRSSLYSFRILRLRSSVSSMRFNERSFWNTSDEAIF